MDATEALAAIGRDELVVVRRLEENWHGDTHWVVEDPATARRFSLRVVGMGRSTRWEERRPQGPAMLDAQLHAGDALVRAHIPFMVRAAGPVDLGAFVVVLYEWLAGAPATESTTERAATIGRLLRQIHRAGLTADPRLPVHDLAAMAARSIEELADIAGALFIAHARDTAEVARDRPRERVVMHGDLNLPNVLWHEERVVGIVDFDQIGVGDPQEELAWVVKWWSRRGPIGSLTHDRDLALAVLRGYRGEVDGAKLAAQLWITGCLNANSVLRMQRAAPNERGSVLAALTARADELASLVR